MEERYLEEIIRYSEGEMDIAEREEFRQELEGNPELQEEMSAYLLSKEAIEEDIALDLRSRMKEWNKGNNTSGGSRFWTGWLIIGLFCAIGITYVSCPELLQYEKTPKNDWDAYAHVHLRGMERSVEGDEIAVLNEMYLDGKYDKASIFLENLDEGVRNSAEVQFVEGLLLYQSGEFRQASELFQQLEKENAPFYVKDGAEYFYLLTMARLNACGSECRRRLETLSSDEDFLYQKESSLLLNRLRAHLETDQNE